MALLSFMSYLIWYKLYLKTIGPESLVRNWPPKRHCVLQKIISPVYGSTKGAVCSTWESTPQTSIMEEHSSSPTKKLITVSTITWGTNSHKKNDLCCVRFSRAYCILNLTWLPQVDLFTTWSYSFATKIASKSLPNYPNRPFSNQSFKPLFFCFPLLRWAWNLRINGNSPRWDCGFWLFRRAREWRCYSLGCSVLSLMAASHSASQPKRCKRPWGEEPRRVLHLMLMPATP